MTISEFGWLLNPSSFNLIKQKKNIQTPFAYEFFFSFYAKPLKKKSDDGWWKKNCSAYSIYCCKVLKTFRNIFFPHSQFSKHSISFFFGRLYQHICRFWANPISEWKNTRKKKPDTSIYNRRNATVQINICLKKKKKCFVFDLLCCIVDSFCSIVMSLRFACTNH